MKKLLPSFIFLFLAVCAFPALGFAQSECGDCLKRKEQMCSQECRLVSAEHILRCQQDCARQYCIHRCPAGDPALVAASLQKSCQGCLEQQFNLCDSNCPTGTDRYRSMCKLGCSKVRCANLCDSAKRSSLKPLEKKKAK